MRLAAAAILCMLALGLVLGASAAPAPARGGVVGTWYGINGTIGTLVLKAHGTYVYNAISRGTYRVQGRDIYFGGPLTAWNHGHGTIKQGVLQFSWGANYFVFERG